MQVLVVHGRSQDPNVLELVEKCREMGHHVQTARLSDLSSKVGRSSEFFLDGRRLEVDVCFLRSFGAGSCDQLTRRITLMEHMELSGVHVINPTYAFRRARDKYATLVALSRAGIPVPETFTTETPTEAYRVCLEFGKAVYKPILGQMGLGSMMLEDADLAYNAFKSLSRVGMPIIVQRFVESPGRDIRAFVIGGHVVASAYRYAPEGSWKCNVARGGRMVKADLTEDAQDLAIRAVEALGLEYAGVDLIEGPKGLMVLEVNGAPGWQGLKAATGVDVAGLLVRYACRGSIP